MQDRLALPGRAVLFVTIILSVLCQTPNLSAQKQSGDQNGLLLQTPVTSLQISGHVLDHNNNPVVGVGVYASSTNNPSPYVDTDSNGFYSLSVPSGTWTVSVNCNNGSDSLNHLGYNCADSENVTITRQNGTANFIVPNSAASELDGYVVDANNNPIEGISVSASSPGYATQFFTTDANGFFEFIVYSGVWDVGVSCTNLNSLGFGCVSDRAGIQVGTANVELTNFVAHTDTPAFFSGAAPLGDDWFYLETSTNNIFGYYTMHYFPWVYHLDMGFEYFTDAQNAAHGAIFYDLTDKTFFYTQPDVFPYLYNYSVNAWVYYCPDVNNPGRYTSNPRWFYNFAAKQWTTNMTIP